MSLPSRERGLKLCTCPQCLYSPASLPSRERGLKHAAVHDAAHGPAPSLPSRERGLKRLDYFLYGWKGSVAPFAGAWIETIAAYQLVCAFTVAPFAGAWIETDNKLAKYKSIMVAPFAGAWIETWRDGVVTTATKASLPSRERGLELSNRI